MLNRRSPTNTTTCWWRDSCVGPSSCLYAFLCTFLCIDISSFFLLFIWCIDTRFFSTYGWVFVTPKPWFCPIWCSETPLAIYFFFYALLYAPKRVVKRFIIATITKINNNPSLSELSTFTSLVTLTRFSFSFTFLIISSTGQNATCQHSNIFTFIR